MAFKSSIDKTLHRYFNPETRMMMKTDYEWLNGDDGKGDALWRTSLAYIAYRQPIIKRGILDCFRWFHLGDSSKYWYQASRHTGRYMEDDVSRDQVILALSALKVNGATHELKELVNHLPFRLSRKFIQTPTMWFWTKSLIGNKFAGYMFSIFSLVEILFSICLNKVVEPILGYGNEVPQTEYNPRDGQKHRGKFGWFKRTLDSMMWPGYAQHLHSWQLYTAPNNIFNRLTKWMLLKLYTEKGNYLFRLLLGDKSVTLDDISDYQPMTEWRWNIRTDGSSSTMCEVIKKPEMMEYNQMDKDILYRIYNEKHIS